MLPISIEGGFEDCKQQMPVLRKIYIVDRGYFRLHSLLFNYWYDSSSFCINILVKQLDTATRMIIAHCNGIITAHGMIRVAESNLREKRSGEEFVLWIGHWLLSDGATPWVGIRISSFLSFLLVKCSSAAHPRLSHSLSVSFIKIIWGLKSPSNLSTSLMIIFKNLIESMIPILIGLVLCFSQCCHGQLKDCVERW